MALTTRSAVELLASLLLLPSLALAATHKTPNAGNQTHWVGTWSTAPVSASNSNSRFSEDTTLREIVHVSIGGSSVRIVLSNAFGTDTLKIGGANVALVDTGSAIRGTA